MTCGIYEIKNLLDGKRYIGYSKNIEYRIKRHVGRLLRNSHYNKYLQNAWNKYGKDNFECSVLLEVEEKILKSVEVEMISKLNTKYPDGYNLTDGGDGILNLNEESKNKIRIAQMGNRNRVGAILSQETRDKISNGNKGKKITEKRKRELSENWSGDKNPNYGKPMNEETKNKMRKSLKGRIPWNKGKKMSNKARNNMSISAKNRIYKKKILFTFRNKCNSGVEFITADTEIEAWELLEKEIDKDESVDDYELQGGIE